MSLDTTRTSFEEDGFHVISTLYLKCAMPSAICTYFLVESQARTTKIASIIFGVSKSPDQQLEKQLSMSGFLSCTVLQENIVTPSGITFSNICNIYVCSLCILIYIY